MILRRQSAAGAFLTVCLLLSPSLLLAQPLARDDVPEPLKPWISWALHGQEEKACPFLYNDGASHSCSWPSSLDLDLNGEGGTFTQVWDVHLEEEVSLPGGAVLWPEEVTVDGSPSAVTNRQGVPVVRLEPGRHTVKGLFRWEELPESLPVPAASGVIALVVEGTKIPLPLFDSRGRLWLQRKAKESEAEERLELEVSRLIRDTIPLTLVTRVRLRVSGTVREVVLPNAVADGYIPLALKSPLPARVEPGGSLRLQVRPGDWSVELAVRNPGPVSSLRSEPLPPPWPPQEIWAFEAMNHLRVVEVKGDVTSLDPNQTTLPENWKKFPVYLVKPGEEMVLEEVRRGDSEPVPDRLELARTIWLSMDGSGYTFRDQISGVKNTGWRLEINEPLELGRVAVNGAEQLITRREESGRSGIELRQGNVSLVAESTVEGKGGRLPVVGWEQDFAKVEGVLNLPPGWRIFSLTGADGVSNTWITRWTLLDFFLVLIFSLSVGKLWNRKIGLLALATFVLTYHEPGAPRWVWGSLLAASALIRVVPVGRFRTAVGVWLNLVVLALVVIVVPYSVREARDGIFPQLERPGVRMGIPFPGAQKAAVLNQEVSGDVANAPMEAQIAEQMAQPEYDRYDYSSSRQEKFARRSKAKKLVQYDPNAAVQTGKGLPQWQWRTVRFSWTGPVKRSETLSLVLLGPKANFVLSFVRIGLLYALVLLLLNIRYTRGGGLDVKQIRLHRFAAAALFASLTLFHAPPAAAAEPPDKEILAELQKRLLAPDECLPSCADIPVMKLTVTPSRLEIELEIHAAADVAVPLPSSPQQWLPRSITIDGKAARGVMRRNGNLWLLAPKGISRVKLTGLLPKQAAVQLPLPVRPHRAEATVEGWSLEGIHPDGKVEGQLQLRRLAGDADVIAEELQAGPLPAFVQVERTLNLGLDWEVQTVVRRFGPLGQAVVIEVPLLEGESVSLEGIRTEGGKVLVNMGPSMGSFGWPSILNESPRIVLEAAKTDQWTEIWRVNASPIWHLETEGIPVIHHQADGRWLPEWRPWPGETVTLAISRPDAVSGQTVTIDKSRLQIVPGKRATDSHLHFTLRSSQGGRHAITLPPGAELLEVQFDGTSQPIRKEGDLLPLPIAPGSQVIYVSWRVPEGMKSLFRPTQPGLGIESVNSRVEMTVPHNRWVFMTGGPTLGPAVQWWGVLVVIVLLALILGKIPGMPLGTVSWILLGIGLSQADFTSALIVAGWLIALRLRRNLDPETAAGTFNLAQAALAVLTVGAVGALVVTISGGLLGYPDLHIAGNGSSGWNLLWYSDSSAAVLPAVWTLSAPMFVYRLLMLAWSLWISFALLRWLRYGWGSFSQGGVWKKVGLSLPHAPWYDKTKGDEEPPVLPDEPGSE